MGKKSSIEQTVLVGVVISTTVKGRERLNKLPEGMRTIDQVVLTTGLMPVKPEVMYTEVQKHVTVCTQVSFAKRIAYLQDRRYISLTPLQGKVVVTRG